MFYDKKYVVERPAQLILIQDLPDASEFSIKVDGQLYVLHQAYNASKPSYRYMFRRADHKPGFVIVSSETSATVRFEIYDPTGMTVKVNFGDKNFFGEDISIRQRGIYRKITSSIIPSSNAVPLRENDIMFKNGEFYGRVLMIRKDAIVFEDTNSETRVLHKNNKCQLDSVGLTFIEE